MCRMISMQRVLRALVVYFHLPTYSVVQKILSTARRNKNKKGRLKPGNEKMYVMHY